MLRSLRSRLALAFALPAAGALIAAGVLSGLLLERHIALYLADTLRDRAGRMAAVLAAGYRPGTGWPAELMGALGSWGLSEGLTLAIRSPAGDVLWQQGPAVAAPAETVEVPVVAGGRTVATLVAAVPPGGIATEREAHLRQGVRQALLGALLVGAGIALGVTLFVGRELGRPLAAMTRVARRMQAGSWDTRVPPQAVAELDALGQALNALAGSLERHEAYLRRMTRDVAHELRTPLAVVRSHLEALQDGVWEPTPERLGLVHREVMRLVGLVDQLGALAEAEGEALHLRLEEIPLRSLLDPLAAGYEPLFGQKGIAFHYRPPLEALWVRVDPDRATQILVNLLANAQRYTPAGGTVWLEARQQAGEARIAVRDTGPGIAPEDLPHLFERLYRGKAARGEGQEGGAGLGLAIARALAEAHGGRIEVRSRPGEGAEFTLVLPAAGAHGAPTA
ncbi:sensor histidine kinase [Caldinitratiruptor microaerophilus]|uniref:histidine kinase n=1 Tax=Caldinitratiruptor microaerophilus TaxID=671077 RepID=A0AA35CNC5_9FIRM|nr:ATP-binding protein [Caldinitratiruptor microaerophilus]BDG62302.1 hypothetical protein caldi_33920 [Caldinitratiruptor microaerophilus]